MKSNELNRLCQCVTPDRERLSRMLTESGAEGGLAFRVDPPLFANSPVFVDDADVRGIERIVEAVQRVVKNPAFQERALAEAPPIARVDQGTLGGIYGYDFHLGAEGPRLIEINTNAGGALLNAALASSQRPCCDGTVPFVRPAAGEADVALSFLRGFRAEFARARGVGARLAHVAIVDEAPASQFLFPEFLLFQGLFRQHGIDAQIADPRELERRDGGLWLRGTRLDLVYNRLTDFALESEAVQPLRDAYAASEVVLTPHPRAHALFANKRHLALFSDDVALRELGVEEDTRRVLLEGVPRAELVTAENAERLWSSRKRLFFKPLGGYGSKAVYRGDKLTRGTWERISAGGYLAQSRVPPSERVLRVDGELVPLEVDVRAYVDQRRIALLAARLYRGQTTNFRTPGGGFAAVLSSPWSARAVG